MPAFCLALLAATGGCAHFRQAHDRAQADQTTEQLAASAGTVQAPVAAAVAPPPAEAAAPDDTVHEITVRGAPDDGKAVIVLATVPASGCPHCDTIKISVSTGGKVLIERGRWSSDTWHYRRSISRVRPARAQAFAASLSRLRPLGTGQWPRPGAAPCAPEGGRGLVIDWLSAERQDRLTVNLDCMALRNPALYQRLLQAPDALGLKQTALWYEGK